MIVVVGGLPGVGKTTIAQPLARRLQGTYLRIDTIEQALRSALPGDPGPAGYIVAYALCESNLTLGRTVLADCVNPISITRAAWRNLAIRMGSPLIEIEVICSDVSEHRRRVETRESDIPGHRVPSWASVLALDYEPWTESRVQIDTARMTVADAVLEAAGAISASTS